MKRWRGEVVAWWHGKMRKNEVEVWNVKKNSWETFSHSVEIGNHYEVKAYQYFNKT